MNNRSLADRLMLKFRWSAPILRVLKLVTRNNEVARVALKQQLADARQLLHAMFEMNPQAVAVWNRQGKFESMNAMARQLTGYTDDHMRDMPFDAIVVEEDRRKALIHYQQAFKGVAQSFEAGILSADGFKLELQISALPIKSHDGSEVQSVALMCQDITGNKRALERINHMAYYDDMTGIPNRRYFREQLESALYLADKNKSTIAIFILDIDRFKLFNDSFGHDVGNMLLLQVAERLSRCVTSHDVLARMEGDEFAVFYTDAGDEDNVKSLAQDIQAALEPTFECQSYNLTLTMSIGIAMNGQQHTDADELMKFADIALSRAKELGRNNYQFYSVAMERGTLDRLTLEAELRKAIQNQEFELYYQPQMNSLTGECIGVEGLIRWNHPKRGLIMPGEFIALAEENGMIIPIGDSVIEAACRQAVAWHRAGLPEFPVSVNLSVRQFLQPNLTERIRQILEETGLRPDLLELEITESVNSDSDYAGEVFHELKELGVEICIDDFGTGYSSLSYLRRFPISRLKIDRSFVRDIMTDRNDAQLVETIIAMARHMGLKVIAEGVENEDQLRFLEQHQCFDIQGYVYSKPMNASMLADWIRNR